MRQIKLVQIQRWRWDYGFILVGLEVRYVYDHEGD